MGLIAMSEQDLSESEWRVLKDLLPIEAVNRGRGRRPEQNRAIINGIFGRLRCGTPWFTPIFRQRAERGGIDVLLAARGAGSPVNFTVWLMPEEDRLPSN